MRENFPVDICPNSHTFQDQGDVFSCLYIQKNNAVYRKKMLASQKVVPEHQFSYQTQVQCAVGLFFVIYQYSWKPCLIINENICGSCAVYMHSGAPRHLLRTIRQYLNLTFSIHWLVSRSPVNWSAGSPFVNPIQL